MVSDILRQVRDLLDILTGPMPMGRLDRAALQLATIEYPDLAIEPWVRALDRLAEGLGRRVGGNADSTRFIDAANQFLFVELGFAGDEKQYYDPRNSCLNDVLDRRSGIPITLSVVYMEVARRLDRPVYGIGLPGHFIVQYDDGADSVYLDPFHGGVRLQPAECFALASQATGADVPADSGLLAPVTHRQILQRMINNLRGVYFHRQSFSRALRLLDFVLRAYPGLAAEYQHRAVVHSQLGNMRAARADFERYLELSPKAPDRGEVEQQIQSLRKYLAGLN